MRNVGVTKDRIAVRLRWLIPADVPSISVSAISGINRNAFFLAEVATTVCIPTDVVDYSVEPVLRTIM